MGRYDCAVGLHGQRCGEAVQFDFAGQRSSTPRATRRRVPTYLDGQHTIKPSLGGWHDAGDYGKYVTNGAFALGLLFKAWEHFPAALRGLSLPIAEHGGPLPDFLAEMKWQIDWLLTTQFADGSVSHKVTSFNFEDFHTRLRRLEQRYSPVGTAAAARTRGSARDGRSDLRALRCALFRLRVSPQRTFRTDTFRRKRLKCGPISRTYD